MTEAWSVDGLLLSEGAVRKVAMRSGLYGTPGLVTASSRVAGRHGRLAGRMQLDEGAFSLKVLLQTDTRAALETARDDLLRRMVRTERLLRFTHTLAGGSQRECLGRVVDRSVPKPHGPTGEIWVFAVVVPAGLWKATADVDTGFLPLGVGGRVELPGFAGATAPMDYLTVHYRGPVTDARVVDARTSRGFTYRQAFALGQTASINAGSWTVGVPAALAYDGPTFFELTPGDGDGPPAVRMTGSNMTADTALRLVGRPGFLV